MAEVQSNDETLKGILWESLDGGDQDIDRLKVELTDDASFEDFGLDSLEMTDFFLRIQDHYRLTIQQEDYADLGSLAAVKAYVRNSNGRPSRPDGRRQEPR